MLTNIPVEHLLGGVSQRPLDKREKYHLEQLENGLSSTTHGLRKRPPTENVGLISNSQSGYEGAWVHSVNRTPSERYTVVVVNGDLKVFDTISGAPQPVYFPDGKGYLAAGSGRGFRGFTVGDHTFIVNRDAEVKRNGTKSDPPQHEALFFVRQADYATDYFIGLDNWVVQHSTPAEATPESRSEISTSRIADALIRKLRALPEIDSAFDLTLLGSTIHARRKDRADFMAEVKDGLADKGLRLIKGSVQSIEDLPARARIGMVVEVAGAPGEPDDNIWVRYEGGDDNDGIWRECPEPGVDIDLDAATMPHELVRQGKIAKAVAKTDLPRKVLTAGISQGNFYRGWHALHQNGTEVQLQWPAIYNGEANVPPNAQIRSDVLPGNDGDVKKVTVAFSLDLSSCFPNGSVEVGFLFYDGTSWYQMDSREYTTGAAYANQTFALSTTIGPSTRVALSLVVPQGVTDGSASRNPRMVAHGLRTTQFPGISIIGKTATGLYVGPPTAKWPMGTTVSFRLDGVAFSYTAASDRTTKEVCQDLQALVDAHASFKATYTDDPALMAPSLDGIEVQKAAGGAVTVTDLATTLDTTKYAWTDSLYMTPGAYAGLILRNLSSGAVATIVTNSTNGFQVNAFTGGSRDTFEPGDNLVVEAAGTAYFVFQQAPWVGRQVGNDRLSPMPSFVDRRISEVFFHAGRLGFTTEDFVVMSSSENLYRFFRQTVAQVLPTDPIDVQSAHKDVAMLDSAVPWDGDLLLSSSSGHQFVLTGEPVLTPETVTLDHVSSFPVTANARPLTLGATVVFPRQAAGYTQVRQMFRSRDRGLETVLLTESVPTYIPGDVIDLCGDADQRFLAVLPNGGPRNEVYVFNYGDLEDRKVQQAWSRWTFGGRVVGIDYYDGHLYIVIFRDSAVWLERINVADPSGADDVHLDRGGVPYTFRARLTRPYLRDKFTQRPITEGRTQVRTVEVNYHDNGYFRVEVTPEGRATKQYVVTGERGKKRVPVLTENSRLTIDLVNDQPQGCAFTGLVYEVSYSSRSYRP